ncbi:MAG: hypothetical protein AAF840_04830, partial [Bacteroidota bacterium]
MHRSLWQLCFLVFTAQLGFAQDELPEGIEIVYKESGDYSTGGVLGSYLSKDSLYWGFDPARLTYYADSTYHSRQAMGR